MQTRDGAKEIGVEDYEELHTGLSAIDESFRELAAGDERFLRRATFEILDRSPLLRYTPQSWPTFVDRSRVRELATISVGLSELIRALPERLFERDRRRIARFYGLDEAFARVAVELPDGISGALARGDFVYGQDGFQCLEVNVTGNLSGWENGLLSQMLLSVEPIADFVRDSGASISHRGTFRRLLAHALEEARRDGAIDAGEFNMLVGTPAAGETTDDPEGAQFLDAQHQAMLQKHAPGLRGTLAMRSYSELAVRDGALYDGPRRLHSVLEWHVEGVDSTDAAVLRCFKSGSLSLFNGPASVLLNDKRNLALLSELADTELFSSEESRLIRSHVPWSRQLLPDRTPYARDPSGVVERVRQERRRFVLKKGRSVGGKHVVIGRSCSAPEWEEALLAALSSGDWIAQEHVESRPFLFQSGEQGCCPHDVVWGPFVFGASYGGTILKAQPKPLGGTVNLWRGATEGIVFEVDDGTPALP